jgi:hypothetical protein
MVNEDVLEEFLPPGKTMHDYRVPANPALDFKTYKVEYLGKPDSSLGLKPGGRVDLTYFPGGRWSLCFGAYLIAVDAIEGKNFKYIPGEPKPPANIRPPKAERSK